MGRRATLARLLSVQGKHGIVAQLSNGLYAASETHLTSRGVAEFNKGLFFAQSPFKLLPGAPAKPRHNSAFVGDYTGVGFLSSVPTRAACHSWHPDVFDTARFQVVHAFASPLWILAGVCYGFASGPPSRTHQLLDFLSDRVVDSATGPRVIAGDFNLLEDANPFVAHWEQRDFVEIQRLWARVSGQPMRPTCKHCTRKDFVNISPELVPLVQSVEVQDDWFADHAVFLARLRLPSAPLARPIWRQPRPRQVSSAVAVAITAWCSVSARWFVAAPFFRTGEVCRNLESARDRCLADFATGRSAGSHRCGKGTRSHIGGNNQAR